MSNAVEKLGRIVNQPQCWDFTGARSLFAGVDIGTFKTIAVVVDETGMPRAACMRRAAVVQSGLIVDYLGALQLVRGIMAEIRDHCPLPIELGATSYPPATESANIHTTRYVLEGAGLEVVNVLDEPSAASLALGMSDGAIVDVGGGTTGVAVVRDGAVVDSSDEATGGVHLSLVIAGHLHISYEEAEEIKSDRRRANDILPIVRPVIEKIAAIVEGALGAHRSARRVCMVGGTCELEGLVGIVGETLGRETHQPAQPQLITPYGIALSCLTADAHAAVAC